VQGVFLGKKLVGYSNGYSNGYSKHGFKREENIGLWLIIQVKQGVFVPKTGG
jgi:hypothetical protein